MSAIFELDAARSFYYVHCTFCIALKLAPTTLRFKRSDIKIEYRKHKIDSSMRRTPASLLYPFYKVIICVYLIWHESLALHKRWRTSHHHALLSKKTIGLIILCDWYLPSFYSSERINELAIHENNWWLKVSQLLLLVIVIVTEPYVTSLYSHG